MKSLLSLCLVAGSAWIAGSSLTHTWNKTATKGTNFFSCNINGKAFSAVDNNSSLSATFTYADDYYLSCSAFY